MVSTEMRFNVMDDKSTVFGIFYQPHTEESLSYRIRMTTQDSKQVLWENISKLMVHRYGKVNLTAFAKDVGIGPATSSRIKERQTSVGTDILDRIAKAFGVSSWSLIDPSFDPLAKPLPTEWPFHEITPEMFNQLSERRKGMAEAKILELLEEADSRSRAA